MRRIPPEHQAVLLSFSSIHMLSSVVAMSVASKRRPPRPRLLSPPSPLPARHPQTQRALVRGHEQLADLHSRPSRTACCVRLGGGGGGGASRHHDGGDEREQQIGLWGAEKHRSRRRALARVPRSASPARATCRPLVSCQLQPAAAPDLGRYLPAAPASPIICTGSSNSSLAIKSAVVAY